MGLTYLWDTNTAIYYLQQQFPPSAEEFIDATLKEADRPAISVITEIELLCWKTLKEEDISVLRDFIRDSVVLELEKEIKQRTVEIRKTNKIKLPDAIIAATALTYDLVLLTRNVLDFQSIKGLNLINPHSY